jgi:trehalose 6-phosphate synthase
VLSTLAGAARELSAALLVNPYDSRALSEAMQTALMMPLAERRDRHRDMMHVLERNDIGRWSDRFMAALQRVRESNGDDEIEPPIRLADKRRS